MSSVHLISSLQRARSHGLRLGRTLGGRVGVALGMAGALVVTLPSPVHAQVTGLTGAWASTSTNERLVFSPGGFVRSCFGGRKAGNAALGQWKTLSPGRVAIEFTHATVPDCAQVAQPLRKFKVSVQGQAMLAKGELALFLGGEFPPDIFRPAPSLVAAGR